MSIHTPIGRGPGPSNISQRSHFDHPYYILMITRMRCIAVHNFCHICLLGMTFDARHPPEAGIIRHFEGVQHPRMHKCLGGFLYWTYYDQTTMAHLEHLHAGVRYYLLMPSDIVNNLGYSQGFEDHTVKTHFTRVSIAWRSYGTSLGPYRSPSGFLYSSP
jgi:hypothetical protein